MASGVQAQCICQMENHENARLGASRNSSYRLSGYHILCGPRSKKGDKGDKGDTGDAGADGVGVQSVDVMYYQSTSATSLAGGSWQTDAPGWVDGKYVWSKTVITYTDTSTAETDPVCITGGKGSTGATGPKGDKGDTGATGNTGPAGEDGIQS